MNINDKIKRCQLYMTEHSMSYDDLGKCSGFALKNWYVGKRAALRRGAIEDEEVMLYREANFTFGLELYLWMDWYNFMIHYLKQYSATSIPTNYIVNGKYRLGVWVFENCLNYHSLSQEQQLLFSSSGLIMEKPIVHQVEQPKVQIFTYKQDVVMSVSLDVFWRNCKWKIKQDALLQSHFPKEKVHYSEPILDEDTHQIILMLFYCGKV